MAPTELNDHLLVERRLIFTQDLHSSPLVFVGCCLLLWGVGIFVLVSERLSAARVARGRTVSEADIVAEFGPAALDLKVYQRLTYASMVIALAPHAGSGHNSMKASLKTQLRLVIGQDVIQSLVRSDYYRSQLLSILTDPGLRADRRLQEQIDEGLVIRKAILEDEAHIVQLIHSLTGSRWDKRRIQSLGEKDADAFLVLLHTTLVHWPYNFFDTATNAEFRQNAQRVLFKLSEHCENLPSTLFIKGVKLRQRNPITGGGFADIFQASHNDTIVALKRLRFFQAPRERRKLIKMFNQEALVWQSLNHPHVLPFLGIDAETFPPYSCMASSWMPNGDILKYLEKTGPLPTDQARLIFEITLGLEYLHQMKIVHGDLRGANILIDDEGHARLSDFGLAGFVDVTRDMSASTSRIGSMRWMAPELLFPEKFGLRFRRTPATDVYSFGCVCTEVYTGQAPFYDLIDSTAILEISQGRKPSRPTLDMVSVSAEFWDLVESCWAGSAPERPIVGQILCSLRLLGFSEYVKACSSRKRGPSTERFSLTRKGGRNYSTFM
ncbi:hypothetical protein JAAARDRAFT_79069 [Jaapia argillacea MUCL 33604]|uniref:Protein kinase domain-containing protein n=1 Tax=Jaapia argillacea MUCL 33604 TaxID=933084 RepID=A0A067Q430_9AGAM|nr:hypothetical protein JAAARDRAFT_79069 [Jaapia argillacea MUCL 33604]